MEESRKVKIKRVLVERHIPFTEKKCPQCGKSFMGMKIQQFCTKACARKASYWRNPESYRESRMRSYRRQKEQQA